MEEAKPMIRSEDLVVQDLNNEILIYDLMRDRAYCLNETAALVWQACDGSNTLVDISNRVGNEDIAWLALNDLKRNGLIEHTIATPSKFEGMSRRDIITKIAVGSILTLPMIASLYAPVAAQAGSGNTNATCGLPCSMNDECELGRPGMGGGMGPSACPFCVGPMGQQQCAAMLLV